MPKVRLTDRSVFGILPVRVRIQLALYGTIGLCGYSSWQTYRTQTILTRAVKENDREQWQRGLRLRTELQDHYVCSRRNLREGRYYTLVTSIWNHGSGIHFLGNMIGLWSFGRTIAQWFGAGAFMAIFYGGAVAGNLICLALDRRYGARDTSGPVSDINGEKALSRQNRETGGFVGASGGVCALTAVNACVNPWGTMVIGIMFVPVPLPNVVGTLGFTGFSAWAQTNSFQSNVAHLGHLGGLIYGVLWFVRRVRGLPSF